MSLDFEPIWPWLRSSLTESLLSPLRAVGTFPVLVFLAAWFLALVLAMPGTGPRRRFRILLGLALPGAVLLLASLPVGITLALVLAGLTVWTYAGVEQATPRRVFVVLLLRLGALAAACLMVLRPSLAFDDDARTPSVLVVTVDGTGSMNIQDEVGGVSRWDRALAILRSPRVADLLKKLRAEKNVQVIYYKGADDITVFDPVEKPGAADGKRSPLGQWLNSIYQRHARDPNLRAVVLISDGADNGQRYPPGEEAELFGRIPCPIHTFLLGSKETTLRQQDLAFDPTSISVDPAPVGVKQKMTVRAKLVVNGYQNPRVTLRLFLDDDPDPAAVKAVRLERPTDENGNVYEVELACNAPPKPREMKVTLKVDPLPGQINPKSNEISTYVTVTKEGLSVLYVEGTLRWEARFIRDAINDYRGLRLYKAFRTKDEPLPASEADWFQFDKQHYDVIIIGDISAERFSGGSKAVLEKIKQLVQKEGTGLLMLRGDNTFLKREIVDGQEQFGPSDWASDLGKPVADLLPIDLGGCTNVPETEEIQVVPTAAGIDHYLMRLEPDPKKNAELWEKTFEPLKGLTKFGSVRPGATVLAEGKDSKLPVLVSRKAGKGRVLVFAGDGTWEAWRQNWDAVKAHKRFWQKVVVWLAQQENKDDEVWVQPDARRVALGSKLGFAVGMRGKEDQVVKDARIAVTVVGPRKDRTAVQMVHATDQERGTYWKTDAAGEYRLEAVPLGKDGKPRPGKAKAVRFLVYDDDLESRRPAADPDTLERIARRSDGEPHQATVEQFARFLEDLLKQPLPRGNAKPEVWPDWNQNPPSKDLDDQLATLWSSGVLACLLLFVTLVCLEWFLRRRWGLV